MYEYASDYYFFEHVSESNNYSAYYASYVRNLLRYNICNLHKYDCISAIRKMSLHESVSYMMFINLDSDTVCIPAEHFSSFLDGDDTCASKLGKEISGIRLSIASALRLSC